MFLGSGLLYVIATEKGSPLDGRRTAGLVQFGLIFWISLSVIGGLVDALTASGVFEIKFSILGVSMGYMAFAFLVNGLSDHHPARNIVAALMPPLLWILVELLVAPLNAALPLLPSLWIIPIVISLTIGSLVVHYIYRAVSVPFERDLGINGPQLLRAFGHDYLANNPEPLEKILTNIATLQDIPVEIIIYSLLLIGLSITSLMILYLTRKNGKRKESVSPEISLETSFNNQKGPFQVSKSISSTEATHAKSELKLFGLEKEILSDALRKLYAAQADGRITEEEREQIANSYKSRMLSLKDSMSQDESLVALHQLEVMQGDLVKLFSDRFEDLSGKVEELRSKVNVGQITEVEEPILSETSITPSEKDVFSKTSKRKRKKPVEPRYATEAEKRIEQIRTDIEKVLDRLGQMEVDS